MGSALPNVTSIFARGIVPSYLIGGAIPGYPTLIGFEPTIGRAWYPSLFNVTAAQYQQKLQERELFDEVARQFGVPVDAFRRTTGLHLTDVYRAVNAIPSLEIDGDNLSPEALEDLRIALGIDDATLMMLRGYSLPPATVVKPAMTPSQRRRRSVVMKKVRRKERRARRLAKLASRAAPSA